MFIEAVHLVKRIGARLTGWPPARPVIGGVLVIALTLLVGNRSYNGLSIPLAVDALDGNDPGLQVFALKLVFTAVTLGFGFYGGEVTPLLVIGSTLGAALATVLGVPIALLAAIGYVAVFAGAANTPLACTVMAVELFGRQALEPAAVGCVVAYVFSSHRSLYASQHLDVAKGRWSGPLGQALRDLPAHEGLAPAGRRRRRHRRLTPPDRRSASVSGSRWRRACTAAAPRGCAPSRRPGGGSRPRPPTRGARRGPSR